MSPQTLAQSYLQKCELRLEILQFAFDRGGWSDVVREPQECAELAFKGTLRALGRDPPKVHDVGSALLQARQLFPAGIDVDRMARISQLLRRDRELAFYGAEDVIPTEAYSEQDAAVAMAQAQEAVAAARKVIGPDGRGVGAA